MGSGIWKLLEFGIWNRDSGIWNLEPGARVCSLESGVWNPESVFVLVFGFLFLFLFLFSPISPEVKGVLTSWEVWSAQHQILNWVSAEWCAKPRLSHVWRCAAAYLCVLAWAEPPASQLASHPFSLGRAASQPAS